MARATAAAGVASRFADQTSESGHDEKHCYEKLGHFSPWATSDNVRYVAFVDKKRLGIRSEPACRRIALDASFSPGPTRWSSVFGVVDPNVGHDPDKFVAPNQTDSALLSELFRRPGKVPRRHHDSTLSRLHQDKPRQFPNSRHWNLPFLPVLALDQRHFAWSTQPDVDPAIRTVPA
jgi:hypothetical protein